ncbi:MAG: ABC transporter permease [Blastochloris viridis]|uniref:ABC transporter permease n=1 Tax=Blastochloris viridis TaxID=1079 RepID=A0A6N4RBJ3_BLAVI|nr:MAG: ABC transporter permease [Blastochloris viridis]
MRLLLAIAFRHLMARKRQSVVSLAGIVLGVAFFMAISSLMQGSEADFIRRLIDNSPHITISDEYRANKPQPVYAAYPGSTIQLRNLTPMPENRGIRGYIQTLQLLKTYPGVRASASLSGQGILTFAGRNIGLTVTGMLPADIEGVTTIGQYMQKGKVRDLEADSNGILIGETLSRKYGVDMGDSLPITSGTGATRSFKVVGIFRTGRGGYDERNAFVTLPRAQALLGQPNRINSIIIKLDDAYQARTLASQIETAIGYKAESWQEQSEDILSTLIIRNIIMYTVVSAVLLVAAFGIYNVISTVVLEKQRDIAILKSMGFEAHEIQTIFVSQGVMLGVAGAAAGVPLGVALMTALLQVKMKVPGTREPVTMPLSWEWNIFAIAIAFAVTASILAALLPARKASKIEPVEILRGGF